MKIIASSIPGRHWFKCPGCGDKHQLFSGEGTHWTFNGSVDRPTFSPSYDVTWGPRQNPKKNRCHFVITDGMIQFCNDCTHPLISQNVEMPELNPEEWTSFLS